MLNYEDICIESLTDRLSDIRNPQTTITKVTFLSKNQAVRIYVGKVLQLSVFFD